jgi:hypothetical protein
LGSSFIIFSVFLPSSTPRCFLEVTLEVSAASWNGAGAQSVSFVEALLAGAQAPVIVEALLAGPQAPMIVEALLAGAQAPLVLQPSQA